MILSLDRLFGCLTLMECHQTVCVFVCFASLHIVCVSYRQAALGEQCIKSAEISEQCV